MFLCTTQKDFVLEAEEIPRDSVNASHARPESKGGRQLVNECQVHTTHLRDCVDIRRCGHRQSSLPKPGPSNQNVRGGHGSMSVIFVSLNIGLFLFFNITFVLFAVVTMAERMLPLG